jgi:hypothetical protein
MEYNMTKKDLKAMKAELARITAFIEANEPTVNLGKLKLKMTKCPEYEGYVLVEPQFDNPEFCKLFRKGPERLSWGANGRGQPRWKKDLGSYRVLKSALDGI